MCQEETHALQQELPAFLSQSTCGISEAGREDNRELHRESISAL
jgi:hypothetical protein